MDLLLPERFERAATAYGYQRVIFEQVAAGVRPPTVSTTPSTRYVGVTRRDTFRPGFADAVRASREEGYLVRSSGCRGGFQTRPYLLRRPCFRLA